MFTRLQNHVLASVIRWRSRRPYVRAWEGGPLLVLPGVLDPVATKVGAWLSAAVEVNAGERWVDMGCGTGVVGFGLAARGASVLAVDVNPRCVRNTRANAVLRGQSLEVVESDLFGTVTGDFDGVVYNVPFWPGEPEGAFGLSFYAGPQFEAITRYAVQAPLRARRVLVALSEAGPRHDEARRALGPHRVLKRERVRSEGLTLYELEPRQ